MNLPIHPCMVEVQPPHLARMRMQRLHQARKLEGEVCCWIECYYVAMGFWCQLLVLQLFTICMSLYVTWLFVCYIIIKFVTIVLLLCSLDALFFETLSKGIFWMEKPQNFPMQPFPVFSLNHHLNAATSQDRSRFVAVLGRERRVFFTRVEFSEDWSSSLSLRIIGFVWLWGQYITHLEESNNTHLWFRDFPYQPYHKALFGLVIWSLTTSHPLT